GIEFAANEVITQLQRQLIDPRHQPVEICFKAINTTTKWAEQGYFYLPLGVSNIHVYEGQFQATKLDFADKTANTPKTAAQIIGLEDADVESPLPARLWNVEGSVPNNGGEFNRKVDYEHCVLEFSSSSGKYRLTKKETCRQFEAPLYGLQPDDITVADILDGLQASPELDFKEVTEKKMVTYRLKR
ncbi:hypothetical protein, partial [Flavobacterium sp.]|uniref:hypothetical protein n=1 Tax=Flavobacterium sp. TaxID=239 RepID=UPI0037BF6DEF